MAAGRASDLLTLVPALQELMDLVDRETGMSETESSAVRRMILC